MKRIQVPPFQELEPQDVREYWADEARDFTPWLADAIRDEEASHLEDVLGLDLSVTAIEKSVGRYNVDILAQVIDDKRNVIIENQLGQSDHDHLGKAIAYAAGVDAAIIVWIAPRFNDEHRDAIQWLNESSRKGVDFFAIRLEVWRIGDSDPAIRFNAVEAPSEWKALATRSEENISDRDQLREEFWTELRDRIETRETPLSARKPRPKYFYNNPIGKSGFQMSFRDNQRENQLAVVMMIEDDAEAFWDLEAQRESIESEIGQSLCWTEPTETRANNMRSQIEVSTDGTLEKRDQWETYQEWFLEIGEQFYTTFSPRIQQF